MEKESLSNTKQESKKENSMKNEDKNNRVINQIFKSTSAITDPNISLIKKPKETKALPIRSLIFLTYFV